MNECDQHGLCGFFVDRTCNDYKDRRLIAKEKKI